MPYSVAGMRNKLVKSGRAEARRSAERRKGQSLLGKGGRKRELQLTVQSSKALYRFKLILNHCSSQV